MKVAVGRGHMVTVALLCMLGVAVGDPPPDVCDNPETCKRILEDEALDSSASDGDGDHALGLLQSRRVPIKQNGVVDVVVVGAGLSGLTAAEALENNSLSVVVFEAKDRLGGRMYREVLSPDQAVDYGGQWLGKTHHAFRALIERFLTKDAIFYAPFPQDEANKGMATTLLLDKMHRFLGSIPDTGPTEKITETGISRSDYEKSGATVRKFLQWAAEMPGDVYPFDAKINETWKELDSLTQKSWARQATDTPYTFYVAQMLPRANGAAGPSDPAQVSLLHRLWCEKNSPIGELPENELIEGGAGQFPALIAAQLKGPVHLGEPVVSVSQDANSATVCTSLGNCQTAKHVIFAMPPALTNRVLWNPPLPSLRQQLNQNFPMGTVAKVLIQYPSRFWLQVNHTGFGSSDYYTRLITAFADSTDPRSSKGVIVCLVCAKQYNTLNALGSFEAKKAALLAELVEHMGEQAGSPDFFTIKDWPADPDVQGGYAGYLPPKAWTLYGSSIIEPHQHVHWAGTETAIKWPGYFEGAITAGKRAAQEILDLST